MEPDNTPEETPPSGANESSSLGLDANVAGLLCYLLGFISGILFLVLEKKSSYVRFHAFQSTFTFIALFVVQIVANRIPALGMLISFALSIVSLVLWVLLMVKAVQGERFKLPVVGDMAEERAALS